MTKKKMCPPTPTQVPTSHEGQGKQQRRQERVGRLLYLSSKVVGFRKGAFIASTLLLTTYLIYKEFTSCTCFFSAEWEWKHYLLDGTVVKK